MMGIDVLEHTERQLSFDEATELYTGLSFEVLYLVGSICMLTIKRVTYCFCVT